MTLLQDLRVTLAFDYDSLHEVSLGSIDFKIEIIRSRFQSVVAALGGALAIEFPSSQFNFCNRIQYRKLLFGKVVLG